MGLPDTQLPTSNRRRHNLKLSLKMTEQKISSYLPLGKTRSKTDLLSLQQIKEEMSTFLGAKKNPMMATARTLFNYGIWDKDIIKTTYMLFSEDDKIKMYSNENITNLLSNLEKLDMVSNVALQSLILVSASSLSKTKPEGLRKKMPSGSIQDLSRTEVKKRLSFLLTISQVLFHKSKDFHQVDNKKVSKIGGEY